MTIKLFGYSSVEHRGEGHEEEGSIFAAIWEGLKEEGACELRFERGFLVQRAHQPLLRPGGTSGEGCEQGSIKRQRRGQREGKGWEQWRRLMGSVTKGLLTGQGWLDFVLEIKSHSTVLNWW